MAQIESDIFVKRNSSAWSLGDFHEGRKIMIFRGNEPSIEEEAYIRDKIFYWDIILTRVSSFYRFKMAKIEKKRLSTVIFSLVKGTHFIHLVPLAWNVTFSIFLESFLLLCGPLQPAILGIFGVLEGHLWVIFVII